MLPYFLFSWKKMLVLENKHTNKLNSIITRAVPKMLLWFPVAFLFFPYLGQNSIVWWSLPLPGMFNWITCPNPRSIFQHSGSLLPSWVENSSTFPWLPLQTSVKQLCHLLVASDSIWNIFLPQVLFLLPTT